ncbi:S-adenosyl-L-methionine-dependent methyltransferase [Pisolithus marmoratus]|nr:S-adenosyl-L-methionine-dependent methyltransferase [Pisolithus marmoratus]
MATFSKTTFDALSYASFRPTYPRSLYNYIFDFHRGRLDQRSSQCPRWEQAVDLGCGTGRFHSLFHPPGQLTTIMCLGRTGQATFQLTPFTRVLGVDPSENMIQSARDALKKHPLQPQQFDDGSDVCSQPLHQSQSQTFEFIQSPAESLGFIKDESVDLVIAAQSCHWFDWSRVWPQLARILRKGGTAAAWIYSEFRFPAHPHLTPLILHYSESHDTTSSVGRYWQQPGRNILSRHLLDVPEPTTARAGEVFEPLDRVYFTGSYFPELPSSQTLPILMRKTMTWSDILAYLRTWSSLHTFRDMHPEDAKNPEGPIEVRFWNSLRRGAAMGASGSIHTGVGDASEQNGVGNEMVNEDAEVEVEWGVAMILARKKYDIEGRS